MNRSDRNNPRRLIRAIEIAKQAKSLKLKAKSNLAEPDSALQDNLKLKTNQLLIIGLKASNKFLYQRIDQRVEKRIKQGTEKEVRNLIKKGYSWNLPSMSACGYKEWKPFFERKASLDEIIQRWQFNEHAYSRRQTTWFKKMKKTNWFDIEKPDYKKVWLEYMKMIAEFLAEDKRYREY